MTEFAERRCRECGEGTIRVVARPGRTWRYKRLLLEVPADFAIPTCDRCGEEWLDPARAERLDDILRRQYAEELARIVERAVSVISQFRSQRALEKLLGLSQGYLSKILGRKKVPGEPLVAELALIANAPAERLREVEATWGHAPPASSDDDASRDHRPASGNEGPIAAMLRTLRRTPKLRPAPLLSEDQAA